MCRYALAVRTLLQKQEADGQVRENLMHAPSFLRTRGRSLAPSRFSRRVSRADQRVSRAFSQVEVAMPPGQLVCHSEDVDHDCGGSGEAAASAASDGGADKGRRVARARAARAVRTPDVDRPTPRSEGVLGRVGQRWDRFADWLHDKVGWSPGCRTLELVRLQARLRFLTDRFRKDAPYWQFVVWVRQAGLVLAVSIPQMGGHITDAGLCIGAGACILVLLAALAMQLMARPYPYHFQNRLETLLLLASIIVIILGVAYAFAPEPSPLLEGLLLTVLLGSLVGGLVYILAKHWQEDGAGCRVLGLPAARARLPAEAALPPSEAGAMPKDETPMAKLTTRLSAIRERLSGASRRSSQALLRITSRSRLTSASARSGGSSCASSPELNRQGSSCSSEQQGVSTPRKGAIYRSSRKPQASAEGGTAPPRKGKPSLISAFV